MMRPVILSRPSKTAIGLLILSASAASGALSAASAASAPTASVGFILAIAGQARRPIAWAEQMRSMARVLMLKGGGMKAVALRARAPGLVVAASGLARTGPESRPVRANRRGGAGRVPDMRLLPSVGLIGFLGRRHVDRVMKPAVPARRSHRGLRDAVINHPAPLEAERRVDARLSIIGVAELVVAHQDAKAAGVKARVEIRAIPPGEIVQQKLLD